LQGLERLAFNDEEERKREIAAERARRQQERLKQVRWCAWVAFRCYSCILALALLANSKACCSGSRCG